MWIFHHVGGKSHCFAGLTGAVGSRALQEVAGFTGRFPSVCKFFQESFDLIDIYRCTQ
jgi:hypothetical protein